MALRTMIRKGLMFGLCAGLTVSAGALADTAAPTEADLDRAFRKVLANPSDLDLAFEYAGIAAALGDFEAAISSLERMLIHNPNLPRVQVELGVLYFRLGSYGAARGYFEQALAAPDMPDAARLRVNQYLTQIDRATARHQLTYSIAAGLRFQSNANSAPGSTVLFNDNPVALDPEFQEESDVNLFVTGTIQHKYDFGNQASDHWKTNAVLYSTRQFAVDDLDIIYAEVNTGPELHLGSATGLTVRPYLSSSFLLFSADPYQGTLGGGAEVGVGLGSGLRLAMEGFGRYADYRNSTERPTADQLDSREFGAKAELVFQPNQALRLTGGAQGRNVNARVEFQSYREIGLTGSATMQVPAPVNLADMASAWTVLIDLRWLTRDYDAPNPIISAQTREEWEVRADAQLQAPLSAQVNLFTGIGWRDVRANIPNFDIQNLTVMGGVAARF